MSYPVGHFSCKLDAKGRLMIPSEFKEQLGAQVEDGFVLRPGLHVTCLSASSKPSRKPCCVNTTPVPAS